MLACLIVLAVVSILSLLTLVRLNNNIVVADKNATGRAKVVLDALKALGKDGK